MNTNAEAAKDSSECGVSENEADHGKAYGNGTAYLLSRLARDAPEIGSDAGPICARAPKQNPDQRVPVGALSDG
jgi:hypothetical protein